LVDRFTQSHVSSSVHTRRIAHIAIQGDSAGLDLIIECNLWRRKEGKKEGRKEGRKEERKKGRKEGRKEERKC
jgi:hypothetical protein